MDWKLPFHHLKHGSLNVPIEHHPTIRYMVYSGYYKVMSNIAKMGQLPTPVKVEKKDSPLPEWSQKWSRLCDPTD